MFLPAALEIIERPVSPTARTFAWSLLAGLALAIGWLIFGRLDVVASAPGRLLPANNIQTIASAGGGVVRRILVREGQHVRRRQPLIALDAAVSDAELAQARKALESATLDVARAQAVLAALDGKPFSFAAPPGLPADVAATQRALARSRLDQLRAGIAAHQAQGESAVAARSEAQLNTAKLAETLPLIDQQIAAQDALLAKGYVSKLKVIEMRRQRLGMARDRDISIAAARRAAADAVAADAAAAGSAAEARTQLLTELTTVQATVKLRSEELQKAASKARLQTLTSPVDGVVAQLAVHTQGGVVEAARPIMTIVPAGTGLVADVRMRNRDVGFVHVGQPVMIKVEAFPFTRYGTLPGRVVTVAADAVDDGRGGEPYYPVRVALLRGSASMPTAAGMTLVADIRTGSRSLLGYLLDPILAARHDAARER